MPCVCTCRSMRMQSPIVVRHALTCHLQIPLTHPIPTSFVPPAHALPTPISMRLLRPAAPLPPPAPPLLQPTPTHTPTHTVPALLTLKIELRERAVGRQRLRHLRRALRAQLIICHMQSSHHVTSPPLESHTSLLPLPSPVPTHTHTNARINTQNTPKQTHTHTHARTHANVHAHAHAQTHTHTHTQTQTHWVRACAQVLKSW